MNFFVNESGTINLVNVITLAAIVLAIIYYLIDYKIKATVKHKIKEFLQKNKAVTNNAESGNSETHTDVGQEDMDSYIDPADYQEDEENNNEDQRRPTSNDILFDRSVS